MDFNEYQKKAASTATYPDRGGVMGLAYVSLGLAGEAGEVANTVKKILRDDGGVIRDEVRSKLIKEVGDVLWYAAMIAEELEMDLGGIADINIDKLADRKERGVIQGSGDNR